MMSFIDRQQAKKISEWCDKHPKEAEQYFKKHRALAERFIQKEIPYAEFKKQSDNLKDEYMFLSDKETGKDNQ